MNKHRIKFPHFSIVILFVETFKHCDRRNDKNVTRATFCFELSQSPCTQCFKAKRLITHQKAKRFYVFVKGSRFAFFAFMPSTRNGSIFCCSIANVSFENIRIFYNIFRLDLSCDTFWSGE